MTLRTRLAMAAAIAAAIALTAVAVLGVSFARYELRSQVDTSLRQQAERVDAADLVGRRDAGDGGRDGGRTGTGASPDGGTTTFQVIDSTGAIVFATEFVSTLPVDREDVAVAVAGHGSRLHDERIAGEHYRLVTVAAPGGFAVLVGRPIGDIDTTLDRLTFGLIVLTFVGIGVAGLLGRVVARRALVPVSDLSAAAHEVAVRQDPSLAVPESGGAELEQLGRSINIMLASLTQAREHERRLIDDAAHELRTPLTSLRTNIEVLTAARPMSDVDRGELLDDLGHQMLEFSNLVGDLDALARHDSIIADDESEDLQLGDVVNRAVRRARRRAEQTIIEVTIDDPRAVVGRSGMLERAVLNVLDNAVKFSPVGSMIDVHVTGTVVTVSDTGPGIPADELPFVFDRFWRSASSRSLPGSGLGLSIVKQVVEDHAGTVAVANSPAGGTVVVITFPASVATQPTT